LQSHKIICITTINCLSTLHQPVLSRQSAPIGKKEKNSIWFRNNRITQNLHESKITPEQKDSLIIKWKPLTYIWELFKFWKLKLSLSLFLKQINTLKSNKAKWDFEVYCIDKHQNIPWFTVAWGLTAVNEVRYRKAPCVVVSFFQSTIGVK
jgi:hypothetical protein